MSSWHSYPSIFALGHRYIADLLLDPVVVQEKVDGSQFSFGRFNGELKARSKGQQLNIEAPEKMFAPAVEFVKSLNLLDGYTYRGEWLSKPKHNTLAYSRTPKYGIAIFDINPGEESYLSHEAVAAEAARLDMEVVPTFYYGSVSSAEQVREFLDRESFLGGQKIEGVVVKNYNRFGLDKKALFGKYVSEAFKEIHGREWKAANPTSGDIVEGVIVALATEARWAKAVQHLRDDGKIEDSPRDIGMIMKEIPEDVLKECEEEINAKLWAWAWPKIRRGLIRGVPDWYKQQLLEKQFKQ